MGTLQCTLGFTLSVVHPEELTKKVPCGQGTQNRTRTVAVEAKKGDHSLCLHHSSSLATGGKMCEGWDSEVRGCVAPTECRTLTPEQLERVSYYAILTVSASDCTFQEWGEWSKCSRACEGGVRYLRKRSIRQKAALHSIDTEDAVLWTLSPNAASRNSRQRFVTLCLVVPTRC